MTSVLEEALQAVSQRGKSYGPPSPLFNAIAKSCALYIELSGGVDSLSGPDGGYHFSNMMSIMKVFRGALGYKRDNEVDKAGYAWCAEQCADVGSPLNDAMEMGA